VVVKKILCIGAHPSYLSFLYGLFRRTGGFEDSYVRELTDVDALLETQTPDLIIYETNLRKERQEDGLKRLLHLTNHKVPIIVTSMSGDPTFQQNVLAQGALWYLKRPFNSEIFQKYVHDALQVQKEIKRVVRTVEFRPEHHHAGVGILSYFSRILERKYPNERYTVQISQEGSNVTLEVQTADGTLEKIETALTDYGLVVKGEKAPDSLFDNKLEALELRNKLDIAALELRQNQQLYSLSAEQHTQHIHRLEEEIGYLRRLVGEVMTDRHNSQSEFLVLINRLARVTGDQATSALQLLAERFQRGYQPADEQEVKNALVCVEHASPGFLRQLNDIFLKGALSGASGNYLYSWLVALSTSLPK